MSYDNTNRGQIWINDKKLADNHPDYKGSINVDGVEYWVSAWDRKQGANPNAPLISFSIKKKEDVHNAGIEKVHTGLARGHSSGRGIPASSGKIDTSPPPIDAFEDDITW